MFINRRVKESIIIGCTLLSLTVIVSNTPTEQKSEKITVKSTLQAGVSEALSSTKVCKLNAGISEYVSNHTISVVPIQLDKSAEAYEVEQKPKAKTKKKPKEKQPEVKTEDKREVKTEDKREVKTEPKQEEIKTEPKQEEIKTEEKQEEVKSKTKTKAKKATVYNVIGINKTLYTIEDLSGRKTPDSDSEQICVIPKGKKLHIVGEAGDRYLTEYDGKDCWVSKDYVSEEKPKAKEKSDTSGMIRVEASAFCHNGSSASGRTLIPGYSVAGKKSWLNRYINVYSLSGKFIGKYRFDDTGYGKSQGYGSSTILPGRSVGSIEDGSCIDLYMSSDSECDNWGRRDVYMEFID